MVFVSYGFVLVQVQVAMAGGDRPPGKSTVLLGANAHLVRPRVTPREVVGFLELPLWRLVA